MHKPLKKNFHIRQKLGQGVVHVWIAELKRSPNEIKDFTKILDSHEFHKAQRFHFQKDHFFYIARHGILKNLLSLYSDSDPDRIQYSYSDYGKPSLADPFRQYGITFNMSHSNNLGIFAFACNRKIGVDIEYQKQKPELLEIKNQYFTENEKRQFDRTPENEKLALFYRYWTYKEAALKAIGIGLQCPLHKVSVALDTNEIEIDYDDPLLKESYSWSLYELKVPPCYKGALVAEGKLDCIQYYQWD